MPRDPRVDPRPGDVLSKRKKRREWRRFLWQSPGDTVRRVEKVTDRVIFYTCNSGREIKTGLVGFLEWSRTATVIKQAEG